MGKIKHYQTINSRTDLFYYMFRNILLVGLPLIVLSGLVLSLSHSSATNSSSNSDSLAITISSSCTLSSVVNTPHVTEVYNGHYKDNIGKTTIKTLCNDGNGYAIYAIGYTNDEEGNNKLINSSSPQNSIETGLSTSGLTSAWAMRLDYIENDPSPTPPTSITSNYNATYGLVPSYYTKVVEKASGTTDMSQGSSFTTTYAVYASSNQYAGTYTGQVKYLLTHPSWQPAVYYMQEVDQWKNTLALEESVQAIDKRDGKAYWVTRLADGNVWMTQNLDLAIGSTNTPLTSENTDINPASSGSGIYDTVNGGYSEDNGVWTWNPASTAFTSNHIISGTTVPDWGVDDNIPYSAEGGNVYYYTSNNTSNDNIFSSLQACIDADNTEAECKHYHRGNYYNWTAAIASNDSTKASTNYDQAANSICPKGWRMPTTATTNNIYNEFGKLFYNYDVINNLTNGTNPVGYKTNGFNKLRVSPLWFVRSGYINNVSEVEGASSVSYYWSSIAANSSNTYGLTFSNSNIWIATDRGRYYGRSVRCLAR